MPQPGGQRFLETMVRYQLGEARLHTGQHPIVVKATRSIRLNLPVLDRDAVEELLCDILALRTDDNPIADAGQAVVRLRDGAEFTVHWSLEPVMASVFVWRNRTE